MQVVHFDTPVERDPFSWVRGTNANLPRDIACSGPGCRKEFHCRASALSRRYAYVLLESPVRPSVDQAAWAGFPSAGWQTRCARQPNMLLGEHDFTSFRASHARRCHRSRPCDISISQRGAYWRFEFEANAFLHHMIRNIMGCLVVIGRAASRPEWMAVCWPHATARRCAHLFTGWPVLSGPRYDPSGACPSAPPAYDGCHDAPTLVTSCTTRPRGGAIRLGAARRRTRIKICGLTREQDVDAAVRPAPTPWVSCCTPKARAMSARARRRTGPPAAALCHAGAAVRQRTLLPEIIAACQ
jgi:tRNA pseudouridine38-40 synthase